VFFGSLGSGVSFTKTGAGTQVLAGYSGAQVPASVTVSQGTLALGFAPSYVRFTATQTRGSGRAPIVSEWVLTRNGRPLSYRADASTQGSSSLSTNVTSRVIDNDSRTCWQAGASGTQWFTVVLGEPTVFDGYRWYTGPRGIGDSNSDPVSWTVSVSADNQNWIVVDTRENVPIYNGGYSFGRSVKVGDFAIRTANLSAPAMPASVASGAVLQSRSLASSLGALSGAGTVGFLAGASLAVSDASAFSGVFSGAGVVQLSADTALDMPASSVPAAPVGRLSASDTIRFPVSFPTVRSAVPAPVSVMVGQNGADGTFAGFVTDGSGPLGLTKRGAGVTRLLDAGSTYTGDTVIESGTLAVQPGTWTFRYVRFNVTNTKANSVPTSNFALAYGEFQLLLNGQPVVWPAGTAATALNTTTPSNGDNVPAKAIDGSVNNRWLTGPVQALTVDTLTGVSFDAYRVFSSGVNPADEGRTPKTWTVDGSADGVNWVSIDAQVNVPTPAFVQGSGQLIGAFQLRSSPRSSLPGEFRAETPRTNLFLNAVTSQRFCFEVVACRYEDVEQDNVGLQPHGTTIAAQRRGDPVAGRNHRVDPGRRVSR